MTHATCAELVRLGWFPSVPAARMFLKRHNGAFTVARIGRKLLVNLAEFTAFCEATNRRVQLAHCERQFDAAMRHALHQQQQVHASQSTQGRHARHHNVVVTGAN